VSRRHRRLNETCVRWATARADASRELDNGYSDPELGAFGSNGQIEERAAEALLRSVIALFERQEAERQPLAAFPRTGLWLASVEQFPLAPATAENERSEWPTNT
jgi:hypothetical protein